MSDEINSEYMGDGEVDIILDDELNFTGTFVDVDDDGIAMELDSAFEDNDVIFIDTSVATVPSGDGSFSDRNFYLNEEDFLQETKKSKAVTPLIDNVTYSTKDILNQVGLLSRSISDNSLVKYRDNSVTKLITNTSITCPDFIKGTCENEAYEAILNMSPGDNLRDIYQNLNLPEEYLRDEIKYKLYEDWANEVYEAVQKETRVSNYLNNLQGKSTNSIERYIPDFLNGFFQILPHVKNNTLKTFDKFISDGERLTHYICPNCGKEEIVPNEFIKLLYTDLMFEVIYKPLTCTCGTLCILDKKDHKKLRQSLRPKYERIKPARTSGSGLRAYAPSYGEVLEIFCTFKDVDMILPNEVKEETESLNDFANINVDWDTECKEFLDFIKMIYASKYEVGKSTDSIHNCAKLLCQSNYYTTLKENALSSLILTLEEIDLSKYSYKSKCSYEVYSSIESIDNIPEKSLQSLVENFSIDVIKDKKIDLGLLQDALNLMRTRHENFDSDLEKYINNLRANKYLLSFIHVSNISLQEEMCYNYFYDERLKKVLEEIADLMIINYLAEGLFKDLSLTIQGDDGKVQNMSKLTRAKQNLLNLNKSDKFKSNIDIIAYAVCPSSTDVDKYLINEFRDADSINYLSSFYDACYREDVYDMNLYRNKLMNLIDSGSSIPSFIIDSILLFPSEDITCDKFDYYFGFDCDRSYKVRFVNLYKDKRFVPSVFEGDTIEEKLNFYESCDSGQCETMEFISEDLRQYLTKFSTIYSYGKFINYSNLFGDYISYMFMRDLLYYSSHEGVDTVLRILSLDAEVASILLEDDFTPMALDNNVLEDFSILCLPLMSVELSELQQSQVPYSVKIKKLFEQMDTIRYEVQFIPGLTSIVEKLMGKKIDDNSSPRE